MIKKWWNDKVAYQIYPKSFYDTNGDGIGDLRGVIEKLDYLKDLGIDIIWLSPVYSSPFADQGYDISDYYGIDPKFGSLEDMQELIKKAKDRDIQIVMDLVVNHCSDEHEWFKEACKDPDGRYGKFFYIYDSKDGTPPTNWRSYFGGSVWDKLPGHDDKYYLHMFHKKQPDLNWENEELREEIYNMINWWFERGIAGFRIDAIINIKKPLPLVSYEEDRDDGMSSPKTMLKYAKGIGDMLLELKERTFSKYDAFTVGEVFDVEGDELSRFISDDGYFSTIFDFSTAILGQSPEGWIGREKVKAKEYIDTVFESQKAMKNVGFLSNIIENHDEPRGVSHYLPDDDINNTSKKMLAMINIMLRGIPFIYQGQEIGMENMEFESMEQIDDISTIDEYHVALDAGYSAEDAFKTVIKYSRDNARTPMQWDSTENAGFTKGKPWLVVNPKYERINVAAQINDKNSVLSFYKELIKLRKSNEYKDCLVYGVLEPYSREDENVMAFVREGRENRILCIANFKNEAGKVKLKDEIKKELINNYEDLNIAASEIILKPYQALVLEI